LGTEIVKRDHILLNGCRSSLDQEIVTAANAWLIQNAKKPEDRIISYCLKSATPIHSLGTVRFSLLPDWQMNHPELGVPEQIEQAGPTIFVAGSDGTFWSKNWASIARKLIIGIPRFGGAGETIYDQELKYLRAASPVMAADYAKLSSASKDMSYFAKEVVVLVERLVAPRNVFMIMSFKTRFKAVFTCCKEVCLKFNFKVERTDESASLERIIPRIETGIQKSAFVIADLTEPSPNVFYELGFARAIGKDVILTARKNTQLPFDVRDIPTILWENKNDLKNKLQECIRRLVDSTADKTV
jgi:hypothetical protein